MCSRHSCLCSNDTTNVELQAKYPEFELRVLTDDIIPPPADADGWQALYMHYGCFLRDLRVLAAEYGGLSLNMDKCGLLLPLDAPQPSLEVRATFPPLFDFRSDGFRIAGSPIGTDTLFRSFLNQSFWNALESWKLLNKLDIGHLGLLTDS